MKTTRRWLARTVERHVPALAAGLASGLRADPSLRHLASLPPAQLNRLARSVLQEFASWLRERSADSIPWVRAKLHGGWVSGREPPRAGRLACTLLFEVLNQEGLLDAESRRRRARRLLESFFVENEAAPPESRPLDVSDEDSVRDYLREAAANPERGVPDDE